MDFIISKMKFTDNFLNTSLKGSFNKDLLLLFEFEVEISLLFFVLIELSKLSAFFVYFLNW